MSANDNFRDGQAFIASIGNQIAAKCPNEHICESLLRGRCPLMASAMQQDVLLEIAV